MQESYKYMLCRCFEPFPTFKGFPKIYYQNKKFPMGNLHHRLALNLGKGNEIFYYSWGEQPKIRGIAKFGGEVL